MLIEGNSQAQAQQINGVCQQCAVRVSITQPSRIKISKGGIKCLCGAKCSLDGLIIFV